jgi:hypothetical protein
MGFGSIIPGSKDFSKVFARANAFTFFGVKIPLKAAY